MIGWAILALYLLGWLLTWRIIAGRIAWEFGAPDGDDIAMGLLVGGFCSLAWPVIVPFSLLNRSGLLLRSSHGFIAMPPQRRAEEAERREREAKRRIADLERELGIK